MEYTVCNCGHEQGKLCKNWTGTDAKKAGKCPEVAEGCPYLVTPKPTEGYQYEVSNG